MHALLLLTLFASAEATLPRDVDSSARSIMQARCSAATEAIVVDGLTGTITYPQGGRIRRPGDTVTVAIQRANLIQYRYAIRMGSKEALVAHYEVVGAGSVTDVQRELKSRSAAAPAAASSSALADYAALQQELLALRDDIEDGVAALSAAERTLNAQLTGCAWPDALTTARTTYLSRAFGPSSFQERARTLRRRFAQLKTGLDDEDKTALESAINSDLTTLTDLVDDLEKARDIVDRWSHVMLTHPVPYLEQSFMIEDVSHRYTVNVTKAPVTANARAVETADNTPADSAPNAAAPDPTFATIQFEGHSLARLGVTLGIAGIVRPGNQTFGLVRSTTADGGIQVHVRSTKEERIDFRPLASVLVYTSPVDNLDRKRRPQFLLTAGTEVSASPKTYVAGFGWDFASGMVVTLGLTRYARTELAEGWTDGQSIPLKEDGTPIIDAVPTRETGAIGGYVGLQFRPSIFKAFWDLVTP